MIPDPEKPKVVFQLAAAQIGEALSSEGFRYLKGKPLCRKDRDDFRFEISFQCNRYNETAKMVEFWMFAGVYSNSPSDWIEGLLTEGSYGLLCRTQIGQLRTHNDWLKFDLALPSRRSQVVGDAIRSIRELALPFFRSFEDLPTLVNSLVAEEHPAFEPIRSLYFIRNRSDIESTRRAVRNILRRYPNNIPAYNSAYDWHGPEGEFPNANYGVSLARLCRRMGLGRISTE